MIYNKKQILTFTYTNWKGVKGVRHVVPIQWYFGKTDHHPKSQWLMLGWDVDKEDQRTFAIKDIDFTDHSE